MKIWRVLAVCVIVSALILSNVDTVLDWLAK